MIQAERVQVRMREVDLTQAELARRVGVSQPMIGKIVTGSSRGSAHLHKIARELQTTPAFLTGETDDPTAGAALMPTAETIAEQLGSVLIPQIDIAYSMGGGALVEERSPQVLVPFFRDWLRPLMRGSFADLFVARGEGDSMMPTLLDGDLVVVDRAQNTLSGQDRVWAVSYGDFGMIKRVRRMPDGGYQINSDNSAVTPITAYDDEMHIIGRVIWIGRRV